MSQMREFEIEQSGMGFRVRNINSADPNSWEYYNCSAVKSIIGVDEAAFGTRGSDNLRKNPVRYDDKRDIIINFHDANGTSPIRFNIEDVNNQPTWTNDLAGLEQALKDVSDWCGGASTTLTNIETILNGTQRTPFISRNTNTTGTVAAGAYNVSFYNAGTDDCTVATVVLKAGEVVTFEAGGEGNTLGAIAWTANTSGTSELLITGVN